MPNPKRKHSRARQAKRRTHDVLTVPTFAKCPRCNQPRLPHRICGNCGYYDGRLVVKYS
ncbi:MAG: 50S ribosomal protein L32 [Planctomycetes bacterium]|nr:50S ribosomal protein L32 [Planctomycetota bacterium]